VSSTLRNALLWSLLPAVATVGIGVAAVIRPQLGGLTGGVRQFASGAMVAVVAVELLPDLLFAHHLAAMTAFAVGIGLMIAIRWLVGRFGRADEQKGRRGAGLLTEAVVALLISGVVIGGGFIAGFKEGLLLTLALTAEAATLGLAAAGDLAARGVSVSRAVVTMTSLAAWVVVGAAAGTFLLWGQFGVDFDVLFAFGLALPLLRALESLVDPASESSPTRTLALFFGGLLLFLVLAGWLGGRHADHPGGRPDAQQSSVTGSEPADAGGRSACRRRSRSA
jgi:zinc transporter, ZIP family